MSALIGIDLGTTNSAAAYLDEIGRPHIITLADGERLLPSAVYVDPNSEKIKLDHVGGWAKERSEQFPSNVVMGFKRAMGDERVNPLEVSGRSVTATTLSTLVLTKLKRAAQEQLGCEVDSAVITVPATFSESAREATRQAAARAGFQKVELINEPTAAILYASSLPNRRLDGKVLVFDLGGGTFDATLAEVKGEDVRVIWSEGDHRLGGMDFDKALLSLDVRVGSRDPRVEIPNNHLRAENLKKRFGKEEVVSGDLLVDGAAKERVFTSLRREDFEEAVDPLMQRVMQLVDAVLDNQNESIEPADVDHILLVGGSTRMPIVNKHLVNFFGKDPIAVPNVDEAVALGAAIKAGLSSDPAELNPAQKASLAATSLADVVSHYLGTIALHDGRLTNSILIPKGAQIPAHVSEEFSLISDGQGEIRCRLTQSGHSEDDPAMVSVLQEQPFQMPAGVRAGDVIQVEYAVNDSNQVNCKFTHQRSGRCVSFEHCFGQAEADDFGPDLSDLLID